MNPRNDTPLANFASLFQPGGRLADLQERKKKADEMVKSGKLTYEDTDKLIQTYIEYVNTALEAKQVEEQRQQQYQR